MIAPRTALLLAGGASRRMGTPKALLEIEGEPLVARIARTLSGPCDRIVLSLASERSPAGRASIEIERSVREATLRPVRIVVDSVPEQGPIAGLTAGLAQTETEFAFVAACDTPWLQERLVEGILDRAEHEDRIDVVLPFVEGRPEPVVAAYRASTMSRHFANLRSRGLRRLTDGLEGRRVLRLGAADLDEFDPQRRSFENVNSPEDWMGALARSPGPGR